MSQTIATNLRRLRDQMGLTQQALATRMGLKTHSSIGHWENGRTPDVDTLQRMATALGCEQSEIDPLGEAFTIAKRKPRGPGRRTAENLALRKSHTSSDTPVVNGLVSEEEFTLSNGGLPALPDADLFGEVLGVWRLLRGRHAREEFVERARDQLGLPRVVEARRKNQRR